jgi:Golgin subfamily A member 5.
MGDELENRLHTLTQTLVLKQTSLETVTTEKNALRLQLEKIEVRECDVTCCASALVTQVCHLISMPSDSLHMAFSESIHQLHYFCLPVRRPTWNN